MKSTATVAILIMIFMEALFFGGYFFTDISAKDRENQPSVFVSIVVYHSVMIWCLGVMASFVTWGGFR